MRCRFETTNSKRHTVGKRLTMRCRFADRRWCSVRPAEITSPFLKPAAQPQVVDYHTETQAALFASKAKQSKGVFSVSQQVLSRYAEKLIEVSRIIKESAYEVVLCPMRGARMPGLQRKTPDGTCQPYS